MVLSSQNVAFVCGSMDGQLAGVAGDVWVGAVLQQQLDTVQVSRAGCVVKDRVSVAGLGVHVTAWAERRRHLDAAQQREETTRNGWV